MQPKESLRYIKTEGLYKNMKNEMKKEGIPMKRFLAMVSCLVFLLSMTTVGAAAQDYSMDAASPYVVKNKVLTEYTGNAKSVNIPANLGITAIGEGAFFGNLHLESVTVPEGVTSIAGFIGCLNLKSVKLPSSLKSITGYAFYECESLKSVALGAKVTSIAKTAFLACFALTGFTVNAANPSFSAASGALFNKAKTALLKYPAGHTRSSYTIPATVTSIADDAFYASQLTSVTLPSKLKTIGKEAFLYAPLTKISIPNSVTSIGDFAFYQCLYLQTVSLGKGVTSIGADAFTSCLSLTSFSLAAGNSAFAVADGALFNKAKTTLRYYPMGNTRSAYTVPATVTSIGDRAFAGSISLKKVTLNSRLERIGAGAFTACIALEGIAIPNSVKNIGDEAFYFCMALKKASIGSGVTKIGIAAFAGNAKLPAIAVNASNTAYTAVSGVLFNKAKTTLLQYPAGRAQASYNVPATVKNIAAYAFVGMEPKHPLTALTLNEGLTSIGDGAFMNCDGLREVIVPNSVKSIGTFAFSGCSSLQEAVLGSGITRIEEGTFYACNRLSHVNIPSKVTFIGEVAFYGCRSLSYITIGRNVTGIGPAAFGGEDQEYVTITCGKDSAAHKYAVANHLEVTLLPIDLNRSSATLGKGESYQLTAYTASKTDTVTWSSSNESIATVSAAGNVTAKQTGTAKITATNKAGKKSYCTITVKSAPTTAKLDASKLVVGVGETYTLTATLSSSSASLKQTWSSSNPAVAAVSSAGKITAKKAGSATITFQTYNGKTAKCTVTVKAAPTAMKLNKTSITLGKAESYTLTATPSSGAASLKKSWKSGNSKVATVDANGKVTAVGAGSTTITVTSYNGKTASVTVTVKAAPTSVKLSSTKLTLNKGKTATLKATLAPSGAASYAKSWTSDKPGVAKVDAAGKVTAVAKGTATISYKTFNGKTAKCVVTVK